MRRLAVLLVVGAAACGGRQQPTTPTPQTPNEALTRFFAAVKANDIPKMADLWGDQRGPASTFMRPDYMRTTLATIQIYLNHGGFRIVEGPLAAQPINPSFRNVPPHEKLRDFRVELQREQCNRVIPITLVQTNRGGWVVYDVHLESAGNPRAPCAPPPAGTRP